MGLPGVLPVSTILRWTDDQDWGISLQIIPSIQARHLNREIKRRRQKSPNMSNFIAKKEPN
jgi:hypothetical protein